MSPNGTLLLALALLGVLTEAYVGYSGSGYHGGHSGEFGPGCGASVCDTCQCVKTIYRPAVLEHIPYACSRRVNSPRYGPRMYPRPSISVYSGPGPVERSSGFLNGGFENFGGNFHP